MGTQTYASNLYDCCHQPNFRRGLERPGNAAGLCQKYSPQTPRDIASAAGENAEHKAPGFKVFAGADKYGGYKCNESDSLSPAELKAPTGDVCSGLKPGDTIQVHWVHTSCETSPGKGLSSCLSEQCANSALRVEAQAFVVVNDPKALDFTKFAYDGNVVNGLHQAKALPRETGTPVVFHGSTTGPKYTQEKCSPLQVTWSVRPSCAKIDINSLASWCKGNVFKEDHAHGVRQLVTEKEFLAEIK